MLVIAALAALRTLPAYATDQCEPVHLFAGRAAVCAIREDGAASCWGDYFENFHTYYPIHRHGAGQYLDISVGRDRSCGIRTDYTVECWYGYNEYSMIVSAPAPDGEFFRLSLAIEDLDDDSCGLRPDGTLVCWQNDDPATTSTPAEGTFLDFSVSCGLRPDKTVDCIDGWTPPDGTFASLATASYPACGLREDGAISCWLETGEDTSTWINGPPTTGSFKQISVHSDDPRGGCAINMDDELVCWGGSGSPFPPPNGKYLEVVAGNWQPCALRADGIVDCWRGAGTTFASGMTPITGPFTHITAGGDPARRQSTCGRRPNGLVTCWGNSEYRQTFPPAEPFASISAAAYHTCGVREDGHLRCWGDNDALRAEPPAGTFSEVSAANFHSCALRTDGTVACWGMDSAALAVPDGEFAQITAGGLGACGLRSNGQVECWSYAEGLAIDAPSGNFESIVLSGHGLTLETFHHLGCGIRANNNIECWGDAEFGLLNPPDGEFMSLSAGGEQACGIRTDGEIVCWGRHYDVEVLAAFDVPAGPFVEVASGYYHSCGVRPDGTVECWGLDQLQSICSPPSTCGNGIRESGEYCDDGDDFAAGDSCSEKCLPVACGQPVNAHAFQPRVSDALFVLQTSVELRSCEAYVCNVNTDEVIDVSDALLVMQKAVSLPVALRCKRTVAVGGILREWEPCPYPEFLCNALTPRP